MAKPKHGASPRSGKQAKPAAKAAQAKIVRKPAPKAVAKPAGKAAHAKPAKAASKKVVVKKVAAKPVAKPAAKKPQAKVAAKKPQAKPAGHAAPVKHAAPKAAQHATGKTATPPPAAKAHPGHGVPHGHTPAAHANARSAPSNGSTGRSARLRVVNADEQTITREDGRYALPATVNLDLPKGYKPAAKEEYMSPRQLAYFRQKLKDWRDQLVEESRQTMENLREEVRDVGDDAERATRETENSLELRTRDRYRKLIAKIEKALRKIEEGRYGYCEDTDEEIGLDRLEARPIATLSLDAQERREHLQKQMGD